MNATQLFFSVKDIIKYSKMFKNTIMMGAFFSHSQKLSGIILSF